MSDIRVIAECGINHGGDLRTALEMVWAAKNCGADTVKFQHIDPLHFKPDLQWQGCNMRYLFGKVRFSKDQWRVVMAECQHYGIGFLCTPQTIGDFHDLLDLGIKEVKISSDNLTNLPLLERVRDSGLPVILSTGMGVADEIWKAYEILRGADVILLHCTSEYPCPPENVRIGRIWNLKNVAGHNVGFSDHTVGNYAAILAVSYNPRVIEKHFTMDHGMEGPDHSWSADPGELKEYVDAIRTAEKMLGSGEFKPTESELELRQLLGG